MLAGWNAFNDGLGLETATLAVPEVSLEEALAQLSLG
jgi:hypothetical protein